MTSRRARPWYASFVGIPLTALRTALAFRDQGLGRFVPFVLLLLAGSAILWVINTVAPLAPFIYSLF